MEPALPLVVEAMLERGGPGALRQLVLLSCLAEYLGAHQLVHGFHQPVGVRVSRERRALLEARREPRRQSDGAAELAGAVAKPLDALEQGVRHARREILGV